MYISDMYVNCLNTKTSNMKLEVSPQLCHFSTHLRDELKSIKRTLATRCSSVYSEHTTLLILSVAGRRLPIPAS